MADNKKHLLWLSLVKAVAMICMVFGHTFQSGNFQAYLHSWASPATFFMSGVMFSTMNKSFSGFAKNKARTLLVPYLIFGFLSIVIYSLLGVFVKDALADQRVIEGGFFDQVLRLLSGTCAANTPIWFLPCLFIVMLLSFPIGKLTDKFKKRSSKAIIISSFILLSVLWGFLNNLVFDIHYLPFNFDAALHMIAFFLLGYLLTQSGATEYMSKLKSIPSLILGVCIMGAGAYFASLNISASGGFFKIRMLGSVYGNMWAACPATFLGIIGFVFICMSVKKSKVLDYIGKHTLSILVMHKFPIVFYQGLCIPILKKLTSGIAQNYIDIILLAAGLAAVALGVALPLLAELIIDKIFPPALGKKFPKKLETVQTKSV